MIKCPYCIQPLDPLAGEKCPSCGNVLSPQLARALQEAPPLWIMTVGFTRHGKTCYQAALTLSIENLHRKLQGVRYLYRDQNTTDVVRSIRAAARDRREGRDETPEGRPRPLIISLYGMPDTQPASLMMYDVAGHLFDQMEQLKEYEYVLREVGTIWILVSLHDLHADEKGRTLPELFMIYLDAMERRGASLKGRNFIVVYTKADKWVDIPEIPGFPDEIRDYLYADPFQGLTLRQRTERLPEFSLAEYAREMQAMSDILETYTDYDVPGGGQFINCVQAEGINLRFCATSALGTDPNEKNNLLPEEATRYRVLDPFLWTLWLNKPDITPGRELLLVLDALSATDGTYPADLSKEFWEELSRRGPTRAFYLGQASVAGHPGQYPPNTPARPPLHRLIGPILDEASSETRVIVMSNGPIRDLADFQGTSWRDRLVVVTTAEAADVSWPHLFTYRPGSDPRPIVDLLFRA